MARCAHLGTQPQELWSLNAFDSPEVQGVSGVQDVGVAAPTSQTDAPGESVQPAPDRPGKRKGVPTVLAADTLDDLPYLLDRGLAVDAAVIGVDDVTGPTRIGWQRVGGCAGGRGVGPGGFDFTGLDST